MNAIARKFGITKDNDVNLLLHRNGTATACIGVEHCQVCKLAKTTLFKYLLNSGGCRIMIWHNQLVIETFQELSDEQKTRITTIVRKNVFTVITLSISEKISQRTHFNRVRVSQLKDILT